MNHTEKLFHDFARSLMLLFALGISLPAWALSLEEAKAAGLIGETPTGYVAPVSSNPTAEIVKLADSVNRSRKAKYQKVATQNGTELQVIETLAGEKLLQRAVRGEYVRQTDQWVKK